ASFEPGAGAQGALKKLRVRHPVTDGAEGSPVPDAVRGHLEQHGEVHAWLFTSTGSRPRFLLAHPPTHPGDRQLQLPAEHPTPRSGPQSGSRVASWTSR